MNINNKKRLLIRAVLTLGLILATSFSSASDIYYYKFSGTIYGLKSHAISLNDAYYPYAATVKVFNVDGSKTSTSKLKVGENVELTIFRNKDSRVVDTIQRLPSPTSKAQ